MQCNAKLKVSSSDILCTANLVYACTSRFGDIYQEDYFINYMKNDVRIVKELPQRLRSLDLEATGSQVRVE
jgi:hypothetical protein